MWKEGKKKRKSHRKEFPKERVKKVKKLLKKFDPENNLESKFPCRRLIPALLTPIA